jgi:chromosome segregation ATPase
MGLFKKAVVVTVLGGIGVGAIASTKAGNYMSYRAERALEYAESRIPVEHEIGRIKKEVAKLDKDIDRAKGHLAEQIVAERMQKETVDNLRKGIERGEAFARKQGEALKEAKDGEKVKWDNRAVSQAKAKELLEADVARLRSMKKELTAQEQMQTTHERSRLILEQQLHAMVAQKSDLRAAVADMEAQIRLVKLQQIESRYQDDGSRLGEIKDSLRELQKKVEIQREKLKLTETIIGESTASDRSIDSILADLDGESTRTLGAAK